MSENENGSCVNLSRRGFLKAGGMSAGVATAAAALSATAAPEAAVTTLSDKPSAGYRETEHVRRVYELSRF